MTEKSPTLTLNNGVRMPAFGLGVFQSTPEETSSAVMIGIEAGYRLIDTAAAYMNEQQVGEGIVGSGIDRSDLFVTTKLWIGDYGDDKARHAFDRSLRKLGLDYLDLYLLHWPVPSNFEATVASFKTAAKLLEEGRILAIGVCNHNPRHLEMLIERTGITPAVNQVELHPFFIQRDVQNANQRFGIVTQAWSPIGGVKRYRGAGANSPTDPLSHPAIAEIAIKHGKTPAQIVLRWHIEKGFSVIPKSVQAKRIRENIDIFDFSLSADEILAVDSLDVGGRGGPDPDVVHPGLYSFKIED